MSSETGAIGSSSGSTFTGSIGFGSGFCSGGFCLTAEIGTAGVGMIGLSGETISLKQDYEVAGGPQFEGVTIPVGHLMVNGQPLSASTPRFENLYSFPDVPAGTKVLQYRASHYFGHALIKNLSPGRQFSIRPDHLFVMGDNTLNSLDSRFWGDFSSSYVIGKSFFVYWPLTKRFGVGQSVTAQ